MKSNVYWNEEQEKAVIAYNNAAIENKEDIFNAYLHEPIRRLCEAAVKTFKNIQYTNESVEDLIVELQSHVAKNIPNVNPRKGKAFAFFTFICRTYLIQRNQKGYKESLTNETWDNVNEIWDTANISWNNSLLDDMDYQEAFPQFWNANIETIFPEHKDIILQKFINCDFQTILNNSKVKERKKGQHLKTFVLYDYVQKDYPSLNTDAIYKMMKRFTEVNKVLYSHHLEHENFEKVDLERWQQRKLTKQDRECIRMLYPHISYQKLAKQFGVSKGCIQGILKTSNQVKKTA